MKHLFFFLSLLIVTACKSQTAHVDSPHVTHLKKLSDSARFYEKHGDTKAALLYHKKALKKSRDLGLDEHEAKTLVNIALILKKEDVGQSLEYLNNALLIAERIKRHELKADILFAMADIYKQQENYKEAIATLEAHQKLLETIFAKSKAQEIAHIKATEARKLERYIYIAIIILVLIVAGMLALYFSKTNRLNKALFSSNQTKDKLFSIIGHDLRGPAGGIMQALDIIDSGILKEKEEKEIIGLLKKQSRSFNDTLNSLLSWASTQLQGVQMHVTRFNVKDIIQKNIDVLETQMKEKNITIHQQGPNSLFINADMDHVDFVIRNLLSNAIKFSFQDGSIDIVVKEQEKEILISVIDHGTGMSLEKQKDFISSDYVESSFGTNGEKGTGLGLMLSKQFIRSNGGRLWLESKEGQGTTFSIALPVYRPA